LTERIGQLDNKRKAIDAEYNFERKKKKNPNTRVTGSPGGSKSWTTAATTTCRLHQPHRFHPATASSSVSASPATSVAPAVPAYCSRPRHHRRRNLPPPQGSSAPTAGGGGDVRAAAAARATRTATILAMTAESLPLVAVTVVVKAGVSSTRRYHQQKYQHQQR